MTQAQFVALKMIQATADLAVDQDVADELHRIAIRERRRHERMAGAGDANLVVLDGGRHGEK